MSYTSDIFWIYAVAEGLSKLSCRNVALNPIRSYTTIMKYFFGGQKKLKGQLWDSIGLATYELHS